MSDPRLAEAQEWAKEDRVYDEPEAKLETLLAANGPLPNEHYHALAAVALRLARALRAEALHNLRAPNPFGHNCEWCGACVARVVEMRMEALADWEQVVRRLGDG